ncbi:segregation/condensation protein A [Ureaplasma miroungigenitalium]|uniref:Segregation and condensation protein A n=1 Tax=Ureaplasma miroungigenitalium TaxID=1042321 RepID=A0ABT3BLR5_9BACT|nr:segregation/condensation protein A [Ureaplasma miroungigenitalium]MCV3728203.1 segregation/condensation protein A [Ureaplasma miroungigenitalium]
MNHNNTNKRLYLQLESYDGPLDVLVELVRMGRKSIQELDIVELANQYQKYVDANIERLEDFDTISDYLFYASHLLRLKILSLLPNPSLLERQKLEEDREDLIQRLIEYSNYKKAAHFLQDCYQWRAKMHDIPQKNYDDFIDENAQYKPLPDQMPVSLLKTLMDQVILEYELANTTVDLSFKNPDYKVYDVMINLVNYLKNQPSYTGNLFDFFMVQPKINKNRRFLVTSLLVILTLIYKEKLSLKTNEIDQIEVVIIDLDPNLNNLFTDEQTTKIGETHE